MKDESMKKAQVVIEESQMITKNKRLMKQMKREAQIQALHKEKKKDDNMRLAAFKHH